MKYYAIAVHLKKSKIDSIDLINIAGIRKNLTPAQIKDNIKENTMQFGNLDLKGNKVVWTQGDYTRYTIHDESNYRDSGLDCVTVLGYQKYNNILYYAIADCNGVIKYIEDYNIETQLERGNFTNCDVVNDSSAHPRLKALGGEIEQIVPCAIYGGIPGIKAICVRIVGLTNKLIIPDTIDNEPVRKAKNLHVLFGEKDLIEYIEFPSTLKKFGECCLADLSKLKVLDVPADIETLDSSIAPSYKIESAHFKSVKGELRMFTNSKYIKQIKFDKQPLVYNSEEFRACENLEINNDMFREGLIGIDNSFMFCDKARSINLPKSLKWLNTSAFLGCININELRINGNTNLIYKQKGRGYLPEYTRLLAESPGARLVCPYDYPYKVFRSKVRPRVRDNVEIVRMKGTKEDIDEAVSQRINKARMIGIEINLYDIAYGKKQIIDTLKIMDPVSFREQMAECLNCVVLASETGNANECLIGKYGLFVGVTFSVYVETAKRLKKAFLGKKYAVLLLDNMVLVYNIDLKNIAEIVENSLTNNNIAMVDDIGIYVKYVDRQVDINKIKDIYERDNELVINENGNNIVVRQESFIRQDNQEE